MSQGQDLLLEIGCEELPPASMDMLARALGEGIVSGLADAHLEAEGELQVWYTPRRLAVHLSGVPQRQSDREEQRLGPAVSAAFDAAGEPTRAAQGFAASCGVEVGDLEQVETDKGSRLGLTRRIEGQAATELLPEIIASAVEAMPIARAMRWGEGQTTFVRPVHWVLVLLGGDVVDCRLFGLGSDRLSYGHRFHAPEAVKINDPAEYLDVLRAARVIVDPGARKTLIGDHVEQAASELGGRARIDPALLEEVSNLNEWPVVITGEFSKEFLSVPAEALVSSMEKHQRFFPVEDTAGNLMPAFVAVANIESKDPAQIRAGLERVIRPRLADAQFFWEADARASLESRQGRLDEMVYQAKLGSLWDKSLRVKALARTIADELDVEAALVRQAALLGKCDLVTQTVYEFPELQGVIGRRLAEREGLPQAVAVALQEQYLPRFSGDALPATEVGQILAIADRMDTIAGAFAAGLKPSGNRDPFALRRAALGVLRILIERELPLDLRVLVDAALAGVAEHIAAAPQLADEVHEFLLDRLRHYYTDQGISSETFAAVAAVAPRRPLDFHNRLRACQSFTSLPAAQALAAANKRIANILRKAEVEAPGQVLPDRFENDAETALHHAVCEARQALDPMLDQANYGAALERLAELREPVDAFFDGVMVMAEDEAVRRNRLALLASVREQFARIADIGQLAPA